MILKLSLLLTIFLLHFLHGFFITHFFWYDGLQHNFLFLLFYNNFAIGLINGIIAFFTHFKICRDGKIDFFFKLKNAIARCIKRPGHVCVNYNVKIKKRYNRTFFRNIFTLFFNSNNELWNNFQRGYFDIRKRRDAHYIESRHI